MRIAVRTQSRDWVEKLRTLKIVQFVYSIHARIQHYHCINWLMSNCFLWHWLLSLFAFSIHQMSPTAIKIALTQSIATTIHFHWLRVSLAVNHMHIIASQNCTLCNPNMCNIIAQSWDHLHNPKNGVHNKDSKSALHNSRLCKFLDCAEHAYLEPYLCDLLNTESGLIPGKRVICWGEELWGGDRLVWYLTQFRE